MAREGSACYIVVAGAASAASLAAHCDVRPWRVVTAGGASGRRASRAVKLRPLLFFRNARYLVFVDWKLRLLRVPSSLVAAMLRDAGFAAFRHPCTAAHTPPTRSACRSNATLARGRSSSTLTARCSFGTPCTLWPERYPAHGGPSTIARTRRT